MSDDNGSDSNAQGGNESEETNDDRAAQEELAQEAGNADDDGELDPKVKAKLDKANREARNLRARLKEIQPLADKAKADEEKDKSDVQKLQDQLQTAQLEISRYQVAEVRQNAAVKAGLDPKFAKYISASDEEDALEQAKELATAFRPKDDDEQRPANYRQGASRGNAPRNQPTGDDFIRQLGGIS